MEWADIGDSKSPEVTRVGSNPTIDTIAKTWGCRSIGRVPEFILGTVGGSNPSAPTNFIVGNLVKMFVKLQGVKVYRFFYCKDTFSRGIYCSSNTVIGVGNPQR